MGRQALREETIRNRTIPEGSLLIVIPWLLHRHRALWDQPDHFIPERFLPAACRGPAFQSNALREIQERLIAWLSVARDMIARVASHLTL